MALAEGEKIGMYTSTDLKDWHYFGIERTGLGTLECPSSSNWISTGIRPSEPGSYASANGSEEGFTTGVAYWTGTWTELQPQPLTRSISGWMPAPTLRRRDVGRSQAHRKPADVLPARRRVDEQLGVRAAALPPRTGTAVPTPLCATSG